MKRSLLVATSVLALATVSKPLFAAESETPAPTERAAPAAERAPAPAAERAPAQERRARPAQQRQAQPRQQTSQATSQSTQQTWTGFQGGGFGGGNVGGAGFADNACGSTTGVFIPSFSQSSSSQPSQPTVVCQALNTSHPSTGSASGGGFIGWGTLIPGTPFYLGAEAMVSANNVKNTYTLNQGYPGQSFACCHEFTTDSRTATTQIGSSVSALVRFGGLVTDKTLVYVSGGTATARVSATFTQTAITNINLPTATTTVLAGSSTVDKTVTGWALGGGAEFAYLPGIKIRVQYMHAQFPDVSFTTPLAVPICQAPIVGATCTPGAESNRVTPSFNQFTVGVGFSLGG